MHRVELFDDTMAEKDAKALTKNYQSDQEETEDEEVKINCILGQSGMTHSDFSDSDSEQEEEEEAEEKNVNVHADEENEEANRNPKEAELEDLVKFVAIGSQIIKSSGVVLYRPTPVLSTLPLQANESDQKGETLNESKVKSNFSIGDVNTKSGFSNASKQDSKAGKSVTCSSSSSISSSNSDDSDADTESVDSDAHMKSASLDFPFVVGAASIAQDNGEDCCESVFDDEEESQETMNQSYATVGASGASVDDKWEAAKQKRVLSSNTLSALNIEAGRNEDSTKRRRGLEQSFKDFCAIPEITLGVEALDQIIQPLPRQYIIRDDSPLMSASSEKEEDKMLSEELEERFQNSGMGFNGDSSIIPLLTPPQSPRTVDGNLEGQAMGAIEWPSNLVMDSAIMTACTSLSPVSTYCNNGDHLINDREKILTSGEPSVISSTTRLRTISVATA